MDAHPPHSTRCFYGFSPDLPPFAGRMPQQQVAQLRAWGQTAVFGGYERADLVAAARAAELPVYAEFGVFQGEAWWRELPDSRPIMATGEPLSPEGWYHGLNPSLPALRERRLRDLERFLTRYDLDGVWLDFIRWPCHWEVRAPHLPLTSFDRGTLGGFAAACGFDIPETSPSAAAAQILERYAAEWTAWRCQQITAWVAEARAIVDRVRPGVLLGLFGVPWRPDDYDGAIRRIIGQDYAALSAHVDVFSPMVYHHMCGQPVEWIDAVTRDLAGRTGKPIWPIIQSVDMPTPLSPAEFGAALQVALSCPAADGVLVFKLQDVIAGPKLPVALQVLGV
jgi:hypothetical protein